MAPTQYGLRFLSYLAYLHQDQGIPLRRVCQISSDLFGAVVSEGTILNACQRLDQQLSPFVDHTRELLKSASVVNLDETSLRVNGHNVWCHVASTARLILLALHEKRGKEGIEALGVAPYVEGTIVHDFWGPYLSLPSPHAFCNVHILRELTAIAEFDRQLWPGEIIAFLLDLKEKTASRTSLPRRTKGGRFSDAFRRFSLEDGKEPADLSHEKGGDAPRPLPPKTSSGASKSTLARSSPLPSTPPSPCRVTRAHYWAQVP